MAMRPGPRPLAGSAAWIAEERASALQIMGAEVEEFGFSARNEMDWLNEHMADIFSENQIHVREIFKTPGKLRGKTPRTARKAPTEARAPLSNIFSTTPKGTPNPFALSPQKRVLTPRLKIAEDRPASPPKPRASPAKAPQPEPHAFADSGYHGSQDMMEVEPTVEILVDSQPGSPERPATQEEPTVVASQQEAEPSSPTLQSEEGSFQSAKEEQTKTAKGPSPAPLAEPESPEEIDEVDVVAPSPPAVRRTQPPSPQKSPAKSPARPSPQKSSPVKPVTTAHAQKAPLDSTMDVDAMGDDQDDETRSPSDGSSPIRPIVRKSSLNFASLPARQPLPSNKSLGARLSRTSHLDQTRMSYYNRPTGGKSLGHARHESAEDGDDRMDIDDAVSTQTETKAETALATHNKTYTQRLQDQINMLGKSNASGPRPSKSIHNLATTHQNPPSAPAQPPQPAQQTTRAEASVSPRKLPTAATPGAFPEDDEDDWIAPPTTVSKPPVAADSLPPMAKSYSADIMEEVRGKETVSGAEFVLPRQRPLETRPPSPGKATERPANTPKHGKSASVPTLPRLDAATGDDRTASPVKPISVSNPTLFAVPENSRPATPGSPKSPSRTMRESPLRHVKNKLSSILKSSKGLLASSAAISAEGKTSLISPSKVHLHAGASTDSLQQTLKEAEPLYPDLTQHGVETQTVPGSPGRPASRRTRASAEREKRELKQKEKEVKEAHVLAGQMEKLEKAREKEREKARIFSKEQERVAAMEKQLANQRDQDKPLPALPKETPKPTRTSPRKTKGQAEVEARAAESRAAGQEDIDMADAPTSMPPPSAPRSTAGPAAPKSARRPVKPVRETLNKPKQLPTVIRVNTSSQQPQFHPSNSVLAATLHDTLGGPQHHQLKSKASQHSLHAKPSLQSLKSSVSSTGRPKALDLAAKRKEQEEREAQRKREAKAEMERKRAAIQEEERRQEQQRRLEAERQREKEREQAALQAEAKKTALRQAAIEKAKQTRAPPPAARGQPNGPPDYNHSQDKAPASHARNDQGPPRPPSRLNSGLPRPQEEPGRPVNAVLSNAGKSTSKRPLQQDASEDGSRPAPARSGPSYQKEAKRMRMTDELEQDELDAQASQPNIKGPPVRPSGGFKKELPAKSLFAGGYTNTAQSATRDLFKTTVTSQHNAQVKVAHPLDMAQVSKAAIPFAPNPNAAGPSSHKTPARPAGMAGSKSAAKSAAKSSPRLPNGDAIELPEIQTDDEDDDDDDHIAVAPWADSPDLRRALARQETMDPLQIFGPPAPLNMEEVFSKSKDRWHKFRARTSSANWSGTDRLTEEDIRKDLAARDKMRREGGWSYELSRDVI